MAVQQGHRVYLQEEEDRNFPNDLTEPGDFCNILGGGEN